MTPETLGDALRDAGYPVPDHILVAVLRDSVEARGPAAYQVCRCSHWKSDHDTGGFCRRCPDQPMAYGERHRFEFYAWRTVGADGEPDLRNPWDLDSPEALPQHGWTVERAARFVVEKFSRDEAQGYHTKDRQFAIELLSKALEPRAAAAPLGDARAHLKLDGCPACADGECSTHLGGVPLLERTQAAPLGLPQEPSVDDLKRAIANCYMAAKRGVMYGRMGTVDIPVERMLARRDEHFRNILKFCESVGEHSSLLRWQLPTEITEGAAAAAPYQERDASGARTVGSAKAGEAEIISAACEAYNTTQNQPED